MFTFDAEARRDLITTIDARQEELRDQMFGANGIRTFYVDPAAGTKDAAVVAQFTSQMTEYIDLELEKMDYPATTYREVFTLRTSIPEGADTYTKNEFEANGQADWIPEDPNKIPMLAVGVAPTSRVLKRCGEGYSITRDEILRATQARMPVDMDKPTEARRIVEEMLDRVYWLGDASVGIYGLLSHPNIPSNAAATGTWSTATAAQIEADILAVINRRVGVHKIVNVRYRIGLPISQYLTITQKRMSDYISLTVAEWLVQRIPQVTGFFATDRLDGAGAASADVGVFVPEGAQWGYGLHAKEPTTVGPERRLLSDTYLIDAKTGGFFTLKPLMFELISGI